MFFLTYICEMQAYFDFKVLGLYLQALVLVLLGRQNLAVLSAAYLYAVFYEGHVRYRHAECCVCTHMCYHLTCFQHGVFS